MSGQIPVAICLVLVFSGMLCQSTNIKVIEANIIIEAGNFIKYEIMIIPILEGEVTPTWIKFEFINIDGTNATISSTMHFSDGHEWDSITTFDIASGSSTGGQGIQHGHQLGRGPHQSGLTQGSS